MLNIYLSWSQRNHIPWDLEILEIPSNLDLQILPVIFVDKRINTLERQFNRYFTYHSRYIRRVLFGQEVLVGLDHLVSLEILFYLAFLDVPEALVHPTASQNENEYIFTERKGMPSAFPFILY